MSKKNIPLDNVKDHIDELINKIAKSSKKQHNVTVLKAQNHFY